MKDSDRFEPAEILEKGSVTLTHTDLKRILIEGDIDLGGKSFMLMATLKERGAPIENVFNLQPDMNNYEWTFESGTFRVNSGYVESAYRWTWKRIKR